MTKPQSYWKIIQIKFKKLNFNLNQPYNNTTFLLTKSTELDTANLRIF